MAGNIKVIEPVDNYKRVSRGIILSKDIDPFTLGVYVKMLTLGEKWQLSVSGLADYLGITEKKVRSAFSKMEKAGYLKRNASKGTDGRFQGWDYQVFSVPTDLTKNGMTENTDVRENGMTENTDVPKNGMTEKRQDITNRLNIERIDLNSNNCKTKKGKSLTLPFLSEAFADAWAELRQAPKWRKKSISACQKCLDKLKPYPEAYALLLIDRAIANDWQGIVYDSTPKDFEKWQSAQATTATEPNKKMIKMHGYGTR
jgi:hypothetical protein